MLRGPPAGVDGVRRPLVALVIAAALWGGAVSGTKYALGGFDPVTLLCVELGLGTAVLWAALLARGYRSPGRWWRPALLGLLEPGLAYLGDTFGLARTSAVHGAVIGGLEAALVVGLAAILLREAVTRPGVAAILTALAGLTVLAGADAGHAAAAGDLLVGAGVLSASLYTVAARRFEDGSDVLSLTAWQFLVAALLAAAVAGTRLAASPAGTRLSAAPHFWLVAGLVGAAGFGLSFLLFNRVIAEVDAGWAAVVLNLIPVFGLLTAVLFLGERLSGRDAGGAALIGSSVLYFTVADRRAARALARAQARAQAAVRPAAHPAPSADSVRR